MQRQISGVGYEGRAQHGLIAVLLDAGITRLVDVRIRAQSRKPGFSKSTLGVGLADAGIAYEHIRPLGTPLEIRGLFRTGELELGRSQYRAYLLSEARSELDELAALVLREPIAMLCFEHDERTCHRLVIAEELERLHQIGVRHLR